MSLGVQKAGPFFPPRAAYCMFQVEALWKWVNMLHEVVPKGKQILRMNLDETSIKLFQDTGKGFVTASIRKRTRSGRKVHRNVSRGQLRTAFTHVAIICDNTEIQQHLPHILIVSCKAMSEEVYTKLLSSLPPTIKLWRRKSSWMNKDSTCEVIRMLAKALLPYKETHDFFLGLDAARIHLNERVWRQAARCGIFMYCIPASLTWALQPCDVYVFAAYKWRLRQISQQMAIARNNSEVSLEQTILAVVRAVEAVITGRCWKHAFEHLGLNGTQAGVTKRTLEKLGYSHTPTVGSTMLTLAQLQSCFPRGAVIPIEAVFKMVSSVLSSPSPPDPEEEALPPPLVGASSSWIGRTRSTSHLAEAPGIAPLAPKPPTAFSRGDSWRPMLRLRRLPSGAMQPPPPPPLPPPRD